MPGLAADRALARDASQGVIAIDNILLDHKLS
jgi:hypothetical protein